jgi:hypothetical protein
VPGVPVEQRGLGLKAGLPVGKRRLLQDVKDG